MEYLIFYNLIIYSVIKYLIFIYCTYIKCQLTYSSLLLQLAHSCFWRIDKTIFFLYCTIEIFDVSLQNACKV